MKKTILSLGILLFVCCIFFWPIFKGYIPFPGDLLVNSNPYRSLSILGYPPDGYPNKAQGRDVITETFPWRYFSISELKQGRIPFWDPYNFSGNILMQNLQSGVFNPFNVIFFLLPFINGWTIFILTQPILASFFFYFLARELRLSRFAAVVGGVGFAFSSYMTVWMEYGNIAATLAYLPILLFFMLRFLKKQQAIYYIGFIAAGVFLLLSGYVQGAFYSYLTIGLFTLYYFTSTKKKPTLQLVLSLFAMFIFPLFLAMFQYLPTLVIFSQSTRWPYSVAQFQQMLEPIWYWVTLFASDFFGNPATRNYYLSSTYIESVAYIGVPFLFFAIFAIGKKRKFTLFFFLLAVFVFIVTTNFPGIAYLYTLPIPVINTTVPTRFLSIFMFCMIVLGAFGIDTFFLEKKFPKKLAGIFIAVYALLWLGTFVVKKIYHQNAIQISITQHNLLIPTFVVFALLVVLLIAKKYTKLAKILLCILIIADLLYVFQKITPFAPSQTVYPTTPVISYIQKNAGLYRFWGYGSGYVQPNFQTFDRTYSPEGNDPLHIKNYGELLASSYNGKIPILPPRPDANLAAGYGPTGMQNHYRQVLLDLLGIKYILQHDESRANNDPDTQTFPKEIYKQVWSQQPWQIYENKDVFPRFFLVNSYIVAHGQKALDKLYNEDLRKTVILSKPLSDKISPTATGSVQLVSYSPQKIVMTTKTSGSMILFLSDSYYSSWNAKIDAEKVPLFLADFAFRAIVVPPGTHIISMYYNAISFTIGLYIAVIGLIAFIGSIFLIKKYEV